MRWCTLLLLISLCHATDEHLAFYAWAPPLQGYEPGFGADFGTTMGNRTVLTGGAMLSAPENDSRELSMHVGARLLFRSELSTHLYPSTELTWNTQSDRFRWRVGAGIQRELWPIIGVFAESHWEPASADFSGRLGLRLWVTRFSTLDARVRSSSPIGAVYQGGRRASSNAQAAPQVDSEPPVVELSLDNATVALPSASSDSIAPNISQPDVGNVISPAPVNTAGRWYVHLGLFQVQTSLNKLKNDPRLSSYQNAIVRHYDASKNAYRLLIGPYIKPKASAVMNSLKTDGLDSFLYRLPQ